MNRQRKGGWSDGEGRWSDETLARLCDGCGVQAAEVLRIVTHAGLRPDQAEIVMQKVWLKFLVKRPVFAGEDEAEQRRGWFLPTIRTTAVDMVRYLTRHAAQSLDALARESRIGMMRRPRSERKRSGGLSCSVRGWRNCMKRMRATIACCMESTSSSAASPS